MNVSVCTTTFHRLHLVTIELSRESSGHEWYELIWCDNGSENAAELVKADIAILHKENRGQARAYNTTFALATGDWICLLGDRCVLPQGWLRAMVDVAETGEVDAVCIWDKCSNYALAKGQHLPELGGERILGGHRCGPGIVFATTMFRRDILASCGYWREDFGLYGHCDVEWAFRLAHRKVRSFVLLDFEKERVDCPLTVEGIDYREWRDRELGGHDELWNWCRENSFPGVWPFGTIW